jgi:hypothetical protein
MAKRVVLGDLWNNEGKRSYLAELHGKGVLPSPSDELRVPVAFGDATPRRHRVSPEQKGSTPARRTSLIPTDVEYPIVWTSETLRLKNIWQELQQTQLDRYPNSAAVTFRVLLELAVDHYLKAYPDAGANEWDTLSKKTGRSAAHLEQRGVISEKYNRELQKFAFDECLISAGTMHRYVHSPTFDASPRHLTAIWDTVSEFLIRCLNEGARRRRAA